MRPLEFARMVLHPNSKEAIGLEAGVKRIHRGHGIYTHPFCPDCRVQRTMLMCHVSGSEGGYSYGIYEETTIPCSQHDEGQQG